ncbi:MAG: hypothetical protein GY845_09620 [Planctomycetes bacterium]|nr:hypothetical protein [Planctomycetota bacterium]
MNDAQWCEIEDRKELARGVDFERDMGNMNLYGVSFVVNRSGTRRHKYMLQNSDMTVHIKPEALGGKKYPEVHIVFRSEYLWRKNGWKNCVIETDRWVRKWARVRTTKVARLDAMIDIATPMPKLKDSYIEVVSKLRNKKEYVNREAIETQVESEIDMEKYSQGLKKSGFKFGSSKLMCRMYDKTIEIKKSGKTWLYELWGHNCPVFEENRLDNWEHGPTVTRIEFQCRRGILREMSIETIEDIEKGLADLWRFLTGKWLRLCQVGKDTNRARWKPKRIWKKAQESVSHFGKLYGVLRNRVVRPKAKQLEKQARGCMVSYAALACKFLYTDDVSIGENAVFQNVMGWLNEPQLKFDIRRRMALFGYME